MQINDWEFQAEKKLELRKKGGNLRQLELLPNLIDFASNDTLGLARSSELFTSAAVELSASLNPLKALGSTGSRLLTGNSAYAMRLEESIAAFHGFEAGLLFSCGYMANVAVLSMCAKPGVSIYFDAASHASLRSGIALSRAIAYPFKHNDLGHLESRLQKSPAKGGRFIAVESIYSTDGSVCPLAELCALAEKYEARLIVDEAHAIGAWGPRGRGLVAEHQLNPFVFATIGTFGKALGTYGAIVLGSRLLKDALLNFAVPFIYTTALPFYALAPIKCSYDRFPFLEKEREKLQKLIQIFRKARLPASNTHIQPIPVRGNNAAREIAEKLRGEGFDVRPLLSPTVRKNCEVLRIALHAFNTEEEVDRLIKALPL